MPREHATLRNITAIPKCFENTFIFVAILLELDVSVTQEIPEWNTYLNYIKYLTFVWLGCRFTCSVHQKFSKTKKKSIRYVKNDILLLIGYYNCCEARFIFY